MGYGFLGSESFIYNLCQGSHSMGFPCQRSHESLGLLFLLFSRRGERRGSNLHQGASGFPEETQPCLSGVYKRVQHKCKGGKKITREQI